MINKSEIDVEIDEKGNVSFHVKGIKGKGCLEYAEIMQKVLGHIKEQKLTSEYYEKDGHIVSKIVGKIGK